MASYSDSVLDKLIARLDADGPAKLRGRYFVGDPVIVPISMLPVCFVSRDVTRISIDSNRDDRHTMPIVLNVVYDAVADMTQRAFAQAGALALYELCEGRDENYNIRAASIAGVLRKAEVLDGSHNLFIDVEGSDTTIEYVLSPPARRGLYSVEAIIRTTLINLQLRP